MYNIIKRKIKSLKKKGKYGAMYMNTVVKVIACVVIGALLISGLAVTLNMSMNTANGKVNSLFAQSYDYEGSGGSGSGGGGGAFVPGESESPTMVDGSDQLYDRVGANSLVFRSSAPVDTFKEVKVDGVTVNSSNYTVTEGSTIVTFKKTYSKQLAVGNHTIDIVSTTGTAFADFTIKDSERETWATLIEKTPGVYSDGGELLKDINVEEEERTWSSYIDSHPDTDGYAIEGAFAETYYNCSTIVFDYDWHWANEGSLANSSITTIVIKANYFSFNPDAFGSYTSITDIYYGGSKNDWNECVVNWGYPDTSIFSGMTVHCSDEVFTY